MMRRQISALLDITKVFTAGNGVMSGTGHYRFALFQSALSLHLQDGGVFMHRLLLPWGQCSLGVME